ncbi:exo-1,3-beta-glucanase [Orbilia oligospora]|uniref:glucan 1,3-beta-glucosidase n=1 Tax=Orbilia oligospora TaxID=2813651 RepID=A0A7C8PJ17_ORBOL|nr:exo-1,3-beta-glucanase [Orbilia oligospora]KAF3177737.1 exo-1,3-beta-glucanase [Orbilia oligospora]KAF3243558.1 exo-1,3-beta-glucanase [Orbilia oligospora]KAF3260071.1 exo-1,3-beta-glucanase [Orbilia oligospora]KAF3260072.1 exo-1,3-beta-glucanase, variant 2 [Orbilia oligospora]
MKLSVIASALLATCVAARPEPVLQIRQNVGFSFGTNKVRGVNIGGWLVLEPWISPSLWDRWKANPSAGPVDEYNLCRVLGKTACQAHLKKHWDTWITQNDFNLIKSYGLNTVRIPIGYWAFTLNPGDPYVQGQVAYLDRAIVWARAAGLKVWIDLHGAPGSQNGFDNSGLRDRIGFLQGSTAAQLLAVIQKVASKYSQSQYRDTVVLIEVLNEPMGPKLDWSKLRQFTYDGWAIVRRAGPTWVAYSDAFLPLSKWNGLLAPSNKALVDKHRYQVFSEGEVSRSYWQQFDSACSARWDFKGSNKYVVVGEWSAAMTDCARWLNGWNRGARYDGTFQSSRAYGTCNGKGDADRMTQTQKDDLRRFVEAQLDSYETTNGWIFWTWKTEPGNRSDDWSYSKLVARGIMPKPPGSRRFPKPCG